MVKGEILVTEFTAPELISACRKAKAIVTDIGGLLSHAAIVSRELNIPCLVGTHNAAKILKTGDEVAIDFEIGIVNKI
jgi:pyruvate,water dikinase